MENFDFSQKLTFLESFLFRTISTFYARCFIKFRGINYKFKKNGVEKKKKGAPVTLNFVFTPQPCMASGTLQISRNFIWPLRQKPERFTQKRKLYFFLYKKYEKEKNIENLEKKSQNFAK